MKDALKFPNGLRWVRLETAEDARLANTLCAMAVSSGFDLDSRYRHRADYYVLTDAGMTTGHVLVRNGTRDIMFTKEGKMVWGHEFTWPWPQYEGEVSALSKHIGVDLGQKYCPMKAPDEQPRAPGP